MLLPAQCETETNRWIAPRSPSPMAIRKHLCTSRCDAHKRCEHAILRPDSLSQLIWVFFWWRSLIASTIMSHWNGVLSEKPFLLQSSIPSMALCLSSCMHGPQGPPDLVCFPVHSEDCTLSTVLKEWTVHGYACWRCVSPGYTLCGVTPLGTYKSCPTHARIWVLGLHDMVFVFVLRSMC